jgi:Flp pilus assembly protein TadD
VSRADRRRQARAGAHDRGFEQRYESAYVGTEGLFFQRLRSTGKWIFVVIALLFAVGFLGAGVGSSVQGGVLDIIGLGAGGGGDNVVSADEARDKLKEKPNDPQALRDLSTALQRDGKPEEAIDPLQTYTALRSKDTEALTELAGLYVAKASRIGTELRTVQVQAQYLDPGSSFLPPATSPLGQAFGSPPISKLTTDRINARLNALYADVQGAYTQAKDVYVQLAKLTPKDADVQIQLADAANNAGDARTALAALKKFLKLAPDDPNAPLVRQQIKLLEAQAAATAGQGAG